MSEKPKHPNEKYYFVSYAWTKGKGKKLKAGYGNRFFRSDPVFHIRDAEEDVKKAMKVDGVIVLNFIEMTKEHYAKVVKLEKPLDS